MDEYPAIGRRRARFVNIYRERDGKFRVSEIGFETAETARQLGEMFGDAYLKTIYVEWRE